MMYKIHYRGRHIVRLFIFFEWSGFFLAGLIFLCAQGLLSVQPLNAAEQEITAVFVPNPADPSHNKFVNTTPVSGYCQILPGQCENLSFSSINFPVDFDASKGLDPDEALADKRKAAYFLIPSGFRTVTITNDQTGESSQVQWRISGFGGRYILSSGTWHGHLWPSAWVYAASPCTYGGVGSGNAFFFDYFWKVPQSATTACVKMPKVEIPAPFIYRNMNISYEMRTPNPLAMEMGTYSGSITYGIGPGQDFDFGDIMVPSDDHITFNFKLTVNHLLNVEFPPGASRAVLQPEGGWQGWLNTGRLPPSLFANHDFKVSSSGKFKVYLECQYVVEGTCGIRPLTHEQPAVGVDIQLTLPAGIVVDSGGQPAHRVPLGRGENSAVVFSTQHIQFSRKATLHYAVPGVTTAAMLKHPGTTYTGGATIIFDADI